ncbi:MAG: class I SAM-dependent methyltransferase [Bacteroidota bacterium]|nr:class I SAM-dependent methyltransferase [Bacteroidota bacterium]
MKNILFFIRITKGLFVRMKLHVIVEPFSWFLENLLYLSKFSKWKNSVKRPEFDDFFNGKVDYNNRYKLYQYVLNKEKLDQGINYLEFGVAHGNSFIWWMQNNKNPNSRFTGFDTFTGLPEDWNFLFKKGSMSDKSNIPQIEDTRAELKAGLFQDTLPEFLKGMCKDKRNVIHMDADLYSSTLYTLTSIAPYLKKGDIVFFDEFFVPTHEFRAFTDFINSYYLKYEIVGAINNYLQLAIKVI